MTQEYALSRSASLLLLLQLLLILLLLLLLLIIIIIILIAIIQIIMIMIIIIIKVVTIIIISSIVIIIITYISSVSCVKGLVLAVHLGGRRLRPEGLDVDLDEISLFGSSGIWCLRMWCLIVIVLWPHIR